MDFQQGLITTIHEYGVTKDLLRELNRSLKKRSTAILIPCLYEEFERPALRDIKEVLKNLSGLNEPLRSHGGLHEREVPFISNLKLQNLDTSKQLYNYDAFYYAIKGAL